MSEINPSDMVLLLHRLNAVECVIAQLDDAVDQMRKVVEQVRKDVEVPEERVNPGQPTAPNSYGQWGSQVSFQQMFGSSLGGPAPKPPVPYVPGGIVFTDSSSSDPGLLRRLFGKKDGSSTSGDTND